MSYEEFLQNEKTRDAVVRNLEIVSEATKNFPDKFKENHPEGKWREITGMRDKLSYGALFLEEFHFFIIELDRRKKENTKYK